MLAKVKNHEYRMDNKSFELCTEFKHENNACVVLYLLHNYFVRFSIWYIDISKQNYFLFLLIISILSHFCFISPFILYLKKKLFFDTV